MSFNHKIVRVTFCVGTDVTGVSGKYMGMVDGIVFLQDAFLDIGTYISEMCIKRFSTIAAIDNDDEYRERLKNRSTYA